MPPVKFREKDVVVCTKNIYNRQIGARAVVIDPNVSGNFDYIHVEWEEERQGTLTKEILKAHKFAPLFRVGDKVRIDGNQPFSGNEVEIVGASVDRDQNQIVARVNANSQLYFSIYIDALTLISDDNHRDDFASIEINETKEYTNDNRTFCYACGGPLRVLNTGFGSGKVMQVCKNCGK